MNTQARTHICFFQPKLPDLTLAIRFARLSRRFWILAGIALLAFPGSSACYAQAPDLTQKSLEDLMNIEVTTVSKKEQKLSQAPAAIYVITQEDIRRSGMTSIPDLLRMVPGLQVTGATGSGEIESASS